MNTMTNAEYLNNVEYLYTRASQMESGCAVDLYMMIANMTVKDAEEFLAETINNMKAEDDEIVFACAECGVKIKRYSREHDKCKTANRVDWFCEVCDIHEEEEEEMEEADIVFACTGCCVKIKRDSHNHDNCKTANGEDWFCEDCDIPEEVKDDEVVVDGALLPYLGPFWTAILPRLV
jgi:hypothetical protein